MPLSPGKEKELEARLARLGIFRRDVAEKFTRSSGKGGQHVNKVSTAVYLKHLPTGIEVKAQATRSQSLNRFLAWRMLADRIEEKALGEKSEKQRRVEKLRRQKRRRSRRSKEKMLEQKRIVSGKKAFRKPVGDHDA